MTVCSCLYPLHVVDKRGMEIGDDSDDAIEYFAMPQEVVDEMGGNEGKIRIPKIETVKETDFDGIKRDYVKVIWADPSGAMTKRYDINDHIMVIGCDSPKCKIRDGKKRSGRSGHKSGCKCEEKEVYTVLHPLEEWHTHHIVEVR